MTHRYQMRELKVEVTRQCPLRCLHCSSNGAPEAAERLEPTILADLIREFASLGGETLAITGGEPLCYEGLPGIIQAANEYRLSTEIYTTGIARNGHLLQPISDRMVHLLAENGVRTIFSLHGARPGTHDSLTGKNGSFDATTTAISKCVIAGVTAEVHFVPMAVNTEEISDLVALCASIGIKRVSWLRFVPQGRGSLNRALLQPHRQCLAMLAQTRDALALAYPEVTIRTGAPFNILFPEFPVACAAGLKELVIRPDGQAVPCDAFKQNRFYDESGNVLRRSLLEVWSQSKLLNQVRCLQQTEPNPECAMCRLYSRCGSGCPAQKAIAAGRLVSSRDPDCLFKSAGVACEETQEVSVC